MIREEYINDKRRRFFTREEDIYDKGRRYK